MVSVTHNDKGRAVVSAVMALPKKSKAPKQFNPSLYFSLDPMEFDQDVFDGFSEKMQALIADSPEYLAIQESRTHQAPQPQDVPPDLNFADEEDIPF